MTKTGVCDVCYYGKGIDTKKQVSWCRRCKVFICQECKGNYLLRTLAASNKLLKTLFK